jgi:hypothetical protein
MILSSGHAFLIFFFFFLSSIFLWVRIVFDRSFLEFTAPPLKKGMKLLFNKEYTPFYTWRI